MQLTSSVITAWNDRGMAPKRPASKRQYRIFPAASSPGTEMVSADIVVP